MLFHLLLCGAFALALFAPSQALAVDSRSDREKVISSRTRKFYKSNSVRKYISFGGKYQSNQSSKEKQLTSRYFYQSPKIINEFNFLNETYYSNQGSTPGKLHLVKRSELYDASISSKALISNSQNYGVFYHRTIYDDMSKFYYDLQTAAGLGRIFFNDKLELDASIGYHDVKAYGQKINFAPSIRSNLRLSDRITFNQRGYLFIDHESMDNELKTSLIYRIGSKLSIELRHTFEKRTYDDKANRRKINEVNRTLTFGIIFDLS